ncbi:hypothetical protein J6J08_07745 [Pseudidiomarina sp. 1APR75-33.1]|uniref:diacylglycerol/lipid kinase family protein n=1 Tax=Pseudidiomarina terrestris TaxID=2820060 RepID=UPI00264BB8DF|nr:diacylglycerol kinase family protein [Pseudidiomarina sp. 1APR75-33.1]MDN7127273.1 hypothetical protein [Pseudidiomarina sp. 1APR75-33.1]
MPRSKAYAIYYKSSLSHARRYADAYQQQLVHQYGLAQVELLASSPDRNKDIALLQDWLSRNADAEHRECLVIGGDGSVNIVAQCAATVEFEISVIPCGTGNDFAAGLGIGDWRWRLQSEGELSRRDLGKAGDCYFVNHAGCGISVALQKLQSPRAKQVFGRYSYLLALFRYLFTRPSRRCKIARNGTDRKAGFDEFQVAAISRRIGGGIVVYPQADTQRQQIGFLRLPQRARWRQLNALYWILRQQPERSASIDFTEATQGRLGDQHATIELDGDTTSLQGPVNIEIIVGGLAVRRPIHHKNKGVSL